ncbi:MULTISPECIES: ribosome assembly RNA-binding protein YhbY [Thiomicrorhabdus]|uniref:Ribosome assembly RNA-binding protein YhbY n=1 Tax=Thiomicrorhabdus heinhorstiae TaxID=2748010 RepID=A0ABS0BTY3_9GAMM|nr:MULTISPECIES: ribosome assembly RNA-binding protein YhbY [Thiomicrorhabdus]MBF6057298.1 ribosome assembly RNA-binding protein YhbY [Thiomicrorhabdus heinhorstiae]
MSQPEKLSANQKKYLRSIAHNINPMIIIGANGVTDSLMAELESTLAHHELLKIKMNAADRDDRQTITDYIIKQTGALLVQSVGKTCVIYRQKEKTELPLPRN